ncbi:unnamed protein product, partial [Heterotrigona itama]
MRFTCCAIERDCQLFFRGLADGRRRRGSFVAVNESLIVENSFDDLTIFIVICPANEQCYLHRAKNSKNRNLHSSLSENIQILHRNILFRTYNLYDTTFPYTVIFTTSTSS